MARRMGRTFGKNPYIYVVIEPDQGGQAMLKWLVKSRIRERVRIITALDGCKDISELHIQNPEQFEQRWQVILEQAKQWDDFEHEESRRLAQEAYPFAKDLLHDPNLLDQVGDSMRAAGYAGNVNPPLIAYVGITSRLLDSPVNLAFVAPSGAGKNRAVDAAVELMPPEAVHILQAASNRALIYSEEDYKHRTIIFAEADSIPDEGNAASAMRSLVTDNCLNYEVVEKGQSGQHKTRRIEKQGPTGLITTSTRSLPRQMNTRVFEIPITDSPEQTKAIMQAQARAAAGGEPGTVDLRPYHALQQYLQHSGVSRVHIPFAEELAELVPEGDVRMRRDFPQLLTFIKSIALLYQCQRERDGNGVLIATMDDYQLTRSFLADVFDSVASEGVTPAMRETVEAIGPNETDVSSTELAGRLNLRKAAVSDRVNRCIKAGYLVNDETRSGCPYKLRPR